MKSLRFTQLFVLTALLALAANVARAQTSTITYQGRLADGGTAANGTYDLQFKLYDALTLGNLQGSPNTVTRTGVNVTNGIFTVQLDFGASAFPGADRFLDIGVKHPADSSYTPLVPRQQLTSTPYAIQALTATNNLLKSGDTMTGALVLSGNPTNNLEAATKQYVDNADALKLNLSGGTMTGALNMGVNGIFGGTAAGNNLTLDSTSNATKGEVRVLNGSNFRVYSDNGLTPKFTVTGTNGNFTSSGTLTLTQVTASPILIKPSSAPIPNAKLFDMQATGAGTTNFSVDAEGDATANSLTANNVTIGNGGLVDFGTIGVAPPGPTSAGWRLKTWDSTFGIGIDNATQWYAAQGFHRWYDSTAFPVFTTTMSLDSNGSLKTKGSITANTTPDIAETIDADDTVETGDVVCADPRQHERVVRCQKGAPAILGVISDGSGGFLINSHGTVDGRLTGKPLVLAGRVPVKVSLENGPIQIGDYLAPSSTPGVAMRATQPGPTVGIALDAFAGSENNRNIQFGSVLCFVKVGEANTSPSIERLSAENNLLKQQNTALQERLGRLEQTVGQLQLVSSAPRSRGQSKGLRQANSVMASGLTRRATLVRW